MFNEVSIPGIIILWVYSSFIPNGYIIVWLLGGSIGDIGVLDDIGQ